MIYRDELGWYCFQSPMPLDGVRRCLTMQRARRLRKRLRRDAANVHYLLARGVSVYFEQPEPMPEEVLAKLTTEPVTLGGDDVCTVLDPASIANEGIRETIDLIGSWSCDWERQPDLSIRFRYRFEPPILTAPLVLIHPDTIGGDEGSKGWLKRLERNGLRGMLRSTFEAFLRIFARSSRRTAPLADKR